MLLLIFFAIQVLNVLADAWIEYPNRGKATLTHYTLPEGYVGSCGCTGDSTKYPIAALSQMAYGSSRSYGPGCGRCFKLTLVNPVVATPPFYPDEVKSVIVKIIDLCPLSNIGWCAGMNNKPNSAGAYLNFDLSFPSKAIPDDFFPSNQTLYGYKDFGVWNINYESVSCMSDWSGAKNQAALGSVGSLASAGCCPADPQPGNTSNICPSFSDQNGLP
ncbi:RlpA-like double-psi beta-barrel-protein domain-containing protein-containing protein [Crepidotus variabilis]|uniref:RlpA-like double-psi beta-barrel-protein domain-containing protein-containing protein n=1 Tax=Crepidotus variabilis TaxID=179855 RepID=A0A9P6EI02_9AGAR|nr:RlpA-like double-psi beta-barrel-protein domain-containing protein-containing protein [Crepidotus variabilis]